MTRGIKLAGIVLVLATACSAQEGLKIQNKGKQKWPAAEAQKIYRSACSVVQREFGATHAVAPPVTLLLGADRNEVGFDRREIRLTKWNPYLLAQGVVMLAFEELMSSDEKISLAKRAVTWADATVEVERSSH